MMKSYFPHILLSLALAVINEVTPTRGPAHDILRNKRSFIMDAVEKDQRGLPESIKKSKIPSFRQHKRSSLDILDLDELFNDPMFAEILSEETMENPPTAMDTVPEFQTDIQPEPFLFPKNEISNVIPGALGPLEKEPRGDRVEEISGKMLDEFLWFMELKESGLLDKCMMYKRR